LKAYANSLEATKENFREFPRVEFVQGFVPDVLKDYFDKDSKICFLHIDLNSASAERAGLK